MRKRCPRQRSARVRDACRRRCAIPASQRRGGAGENKAQQRPKRERPKRSLVEPRRPVARAAAGEAKPILDGRMYGQSTRSPPRSRKRTRTESGHSGPRTESGRSEVAASWPCASPRQRPPHSGHDSTAEPKANENSQAERAAMRAQGSGPIAAVPRMRERAMRVLPYLCVPVRARPSAP